MKVIEYLEARGESQASFARRIGVKQSTLNQICLGAGCNADTANLIIIGSGYEVTLKDLIKQPTAEDGP